MPNRKHLSKRVRFEVFKRDSFKCQYCGASSPNVLLHIDHIHPIAAGGDQTDITNLITACESCNSGKSDKLLSDTAVATKRKAQLDHLQERREQLEMMAEWQRGLIDLDGQALQECASLWESAVTGFKLNETGLADLRKLVKQFGMSEVMYGIRRSTEYYLQRDSDGNITKDSAGLSLEKIGGVCALERRQRDNPMLVDAYKIRAMMRGRMRGFSQWQDRKALEWINALFLLGCEPDDVRRLLIGIEKWWPFEELMESEIRRRKGLDG